MGAPEHSHLGKERDGGGAIARAQVDRIRAALVFREPRAADGAGKSVPASVLVPIFEKAGEIHLLFTRRTESVRDHKGEISFPGGRQDPGDPTPLAAALREAEEEVGIAARDVRILGALDQIMTITNYVVSPFVGEIGFPYPFRANEREIAELIEVPLTALLDPAIHTVEEVWLREGELYAVHYFQWGSYTIWGATAKILKGLLERAFGWKGSGSTPPTR